MTFPSPQEESDEFQMYFFQVLQGFFSGTLRWKSIACQDSMPDRRAPVSSNQGVR